MRKIQMLASMEGTIQGHPCDHRSSQQVILTLLVCVSLARRRPLFEASCHCLQKYSFNHLF